MNDMFIFISFKATSSMKVIHLIAFLVNRNYFLI
jgi:hypothetical protein